MEVRFEETFEDDISKASDMDAKERVKEFVLRVKKAQTLTGIGSLKKIKGFKDFYRARIGDYRIGLEVSGKEVIFVRFLHRKDIYRHFPKQ
jgi:mRNA interferase RelE/StbE